MHPWLRIAVEAGPLVIFFAAVGLGGIYWATGAFMVATLISLSLSYYFERKLPLMPLVGGGFVLVFGALTLYLADATFIKLKPTLVNALFALILFAGLAFGRPLLKTVMGASFQLTDEGWRKLTWRWALFFVLMAATNEAVWRNSSDEFWAGFKLFGFLPMTFAFALAQMPLINRFQLQPEAAPTQRP